MATVKFLNINGKLETTTEQLESAGGYKVVSQDGDIAIIEVSRDVEIALHQSGASAENEAPRLKPVPLQWKVQLS